MCRPRYNRLVARPFQVSPPKVANNPILWSDLVLPTGEAATSTGAFDFYQQQQQPQQLEGTCADLVEATTTQYDPNSPVDSLVDSLFSEQQEHICPWFTKQLSDCSPSSPSSDAVLDNLLPTLFDFQQDIADLQRESGYSSSSNASYTSGNTGSPVAAFDDILPLGTEQLLRELEAPCRIQADVKNADIKPKRKRKRNRQIVKVADLHPQVQKKLRDNNKVSARKHRLTVKQKLQQEMEKSELLAQRNRELSQIVGVLQTEMQTLLQLVATLR